MQIFKLKANLLINNNTKQGAVMQNFFLRAGNVMQIKYFKFNIQHGDYLMYIFTAKLIRDQCVIVLNSKRI